MKVFGICLLLIGISACGPADSTPAGADKTTSAESDQVSEAVAETVEQALKGDLGANEVSEGSCAMLEDGVVPEMFGVDAGLVNYRRSIPVKRVGHVVCMANWERPDKAELEAAFMQKMQEWGRGKATGKKEPMPKPARLENSVSITLVATEFDSADAAVSSLESTVATLEKGVTTNVGGKDYTVQSDFGGWIDNLGDRAIFTDKGELLLAYKGRRYAVNVEVSDDPAEDRNLAIDLARRLLGSA